MNPKSQVVAIAVLIASFPSGGVLAQKVEAGARAVLEIPNYEPTHRNLRVKSVDPRGTVRIEVRDDMPNLHYSFAEGYYLLMADPETNPGRPRLFRARVDEVTSPASFTLTVGPAAAARLAVGTACALARPWGSTTAQLKALPDVIPVGPRPADSPSAAIDAQRAASVLNLKHLALALHNFESSYGFFPPAVIYGPDGKPWHSWRVLILPYVEQAELYEAYDFSEPWDGPKNRKLLDRMPDVYRDPVHGDAQGNSTHYAALVGEWKGQFQVVHTAMPPGGPRMKDAHQPIADVLKVGTGPLAAITDGPGNTIMVAPIGPERKVPWTRPEDIAVGPDFPGLGKPRGIAASYRTGPKLDGPRGAPVLFADGSTVVLLDTIDPRDLLAMATRDGAQAGFLVEEVNFARIPVLPEARRLPGTDALPTLKVEALPDGTARAWIER